MSDQPPWLCRFVLSDQKRKGGAKRQNETVINRKKPHPLQPGQTISVPYRVTDNPLRFSQQDWCVVVAASQTKSAFKPSPSPNSTLPLFVLVSVAGTQFFTQGV